MSGIIGGAGSKSGVIGDTELAVIEPWISLSSYFVYSWQNQDSSDYNCEYRMWGNVVFVRGLCQSGTNPIIFESLPTRMRPAKVHLLGMARDGGYANGTNVHKALYINPNGSIGHYDYKASWTSVSCTYSVD